MALLCQIMSEWRRAGGRLFPYLTGLFLDFTVFCSFSREGGEWSSAPEKLLNEHAELTDDAVLRTEELYAESTMRFNKLNGTNINSGTGLYDPANEHDSCGVGFIADIKNRKSHKIVQDGLTILANLTHRGAVGADPLAGDGAGILIQVPDRLMRSEAEKLGFELPAPGEYAVGMVFMPRNDSTQKECEFALELMASEEG